MASASDRGVTCGKERTRTFKTKREARAFLAQVEGDTTRGLYVDPAGSQLRLRELADRWWAAREVELTTAAASRSRLDNHVLAMWGEWPIGRIGHLDVQAWVTRLSRRLAPETVASCHGLLSAILATAVRSRKLGTNPCDGVRLPPRRRTADAGVTITREQLLGQVLPALPRRHRALVATAAPCSASHRPSSSGRPGRGEVLLSMASRGRCADRGRRLN